MIFLFKWTAEEEPSGSIVQDSRLDSIFFAKQVLSLSVSLSRRLSLQVINNACATQAILSVLMNIQDPSVTLGPTLQVSTKISCVGETDDSCNGSILGIERILWFF